MERYHPIWRFEGKHADVLNRYTTSLVLTDNDGRQADSVRIQLGGMQKQGIPNIKEEIGLAIGYADENGRKLYDKGAYLISRPKLSLNNNSVLINAVSAKFARNDKSGFTVKKSRTFIDRTVKQIFEALTQPHGYEIVIDEKLGAKVVTQFEQSQSDSATIHKLATQFDSTAKPLGAYSGTYVMGPKGSNLTLLENQKVARNYSLKNNKDIQSLELTAYSRDFFLGVECPWQCLDKAERFYVKVGQEKFKRIAQRSDELSARQAAEAELKTMQRKGRQIRCVVLGDPKLVSEGIASFDNAFPSQYQGQWSIDTVIHTLNANAYTTTFTASALID